MESFLEIAGAFVKILLEDILRHPVANPIKYNIIIMKETTYIV